MQSLKIIKLNPNVNANEGKYKYLSAFNIAIGIRFETGINVIKNHIKQNPTNLLFFLNLKKITIKAMRRIAPAIILISEKEGGKGTSYLTFRFIGKSNSFI